MIDISRTPGPHCDGLRPGPVGPADRLRRFVASETAAITVDYLVLSFIVIALAVGATAVVRESATELGGLVEGSLDEAELRDLRFD